MSILIALAFNAFFPIRQGRIICVTHLMCKIIKKDKLKDQIRVKIRIETVKCYAKMRFEKKSSKRQI